MAVTLQLQEIPNASPKPGNGRKMSSCRKMFFFSCGEKKKPGEKLLSWKCGSQLKLTDPPRPPPSIRLEWDSNTRTKPTCTSSSTRTEIIPKCCVMSWDCLKAHHTQPGSSSCWWLDDDGPAALGQLCFLFFFSVSRACWGVTSRTFSHREYLGRQLQSTDQQQAPAVAARSWTVPCACVLVYQCVDDCSGCTSVFVILEISCLLCVRTWKSRGAVSPNDPRCDLIGLPCFVLCPRSVMCGDMCLCYMIFKSHL